MLVSNIIGKPVISIYDGEVLGTVISLNINKRYKKIESLIIFNDDIEEDYSLFVNYIYKLNDAIMVKNKNLIVLTKGAESNCFSKLPFNCSLISTEGKNIGKLIDLEIDDKFNILKIHSENKNYDVSNLLNVGNNLMILSNEKESLYKYKFKVNINKNIKDTEVNILNSGIKILEAKDIIQESPKKVSLSANFLFGRKLKSDIFDEKGTVVFKKNLIINQAVIDKAIKLNKYRNLIELSSSN